MVQKPGRHCLLYRTARHRPVAGRQRPTGEKGWGNSGPVTRASLHSSPATQQKGTTVGLHSVLDLGVIHRHRVREHVQLRHAVHENEVSVAQAL